MDESPIRNEELNEITEPVPAPAPPAKKRRRGHFRYAAPLGFLVLLFAVIGVISTAVGAVNWVKTWNDDTALRNELSLFLDPVMAMCPPPFEDAGSAEDQSTLIMAAVYDIAETERIRQLREKDNTCVYELEETQWRMIVPQADVEASFAALFGGKVIRQHKGVGDAEYDAQNKCYYVPLALSRAAYVPVLDTIKHKKDTYTVRVAYVANADIAYDERGNALTPTADMSKYAQHFTVQKNEDGSWALLSVTAEVKAQ